LRLSGVLPGSAAAAARLREGDVIVRLAGTPVDGLDDVRAVLLEKKPGDLVSVVYLRVGDAHTTSATLGARP
ncbi:MAG: PDZ domain-containing protein, partial [Candidatus Rokuibacteriota bacterium]